MGARAASLTCRKVIDKKFPGGHAKLHQNIVPEKYVWIKNKASYIAGLEYHFCYIVGIFYLNTAREYVDFDLDSGCSEFTFLESSLPADL